MKLEPQFGMPPKTIFPNDVPRFPNLWFYVADTIGGSHEAAARWLIDSLSERCGLIDDFQTYKAEAADDKGRARELFPYAGFEACEFNHDHDLHIRYYHSELRRRGMEKPPALPNFFQIAASIHFEVAQDHRYHPYIDPCPICGVTGDYDLQGDRCEMIHDPLGLELILHGTIRGCPKLDSKFGSFRTLDMLADRAQVKIEEANATREDVNTLRIAAICLDAKSD